MVNIFKKIVGSKNDRELRRMRPLVEEINALEPAISALSNEELRAKTDEFRARLREQTANERAQLETLQTQRQGAEVVGRQPELSQQLKRRQL